MSPELKPRPGPVHGPAFGGPLSPCLCGVLLPCGWSNHRCPEREQAQRELREMAGLEDGE